MLFLLLLVAQGLPLPAPKLWGLTPFEPNSTIGPNIEWAQDAPTMNDIWRYVYRVYLDDQKIGGKQLGNPRCTGTYPPFQCNAPMPSITTTVGTHTFKLTVALFISGDSVQYPSQTGPESWSNSATFRVRQPPPKVYIALPYEKPPVVIR